MSDPIQNTNGMKLSIIQKMNSINKFIAASAVIIFPASVLGMDKLHGLVFIIIFLLGLWLLFSDYKNIFPLLKDEKYFFFALSIVMVTVIITTLINNTDMARADRFLAPVMAIPVYLHFKRYLVDEKYLWIGLVLGALIAASIAIYQMFWLTTFRRAAGVVNPIIFGDLSLLMGVMSLAGMAWFKAQKQWMIIIPALAMAAGLLASGLSLVRGGWLALPLLILLLMWYASKRLKLKVIFLGLSLMLLTVSSLYFVSQTGVQKRIAASWINLDRYLDSQDVNDKVRGASDGVRFEMWKAAWIIFKDNPVVGGGWGDYMEKAQALVDKGVVNKIAAKYYHPHNQFMSALAKGGLFGFLAISALFLFPAIIFYRSISHSNAAETRRLALAGLILIVGFVGFGLTESILERSRSIIFFSFYLAVLMALVQFSRHKHSIKAELAVAGADYVEQGGVETVSIEILDSEQIKREDQRIILEKDVAAVFKDSKSVNRALRMLMSIAEKSAKKNDG